MTQLTIRLANHTLAHKIFVKMDQSMSDWTLLVVVAPLASSTSMTLILLSSLSYSVWSALSCTSLCLIITQTISVRPQITLLHLSVWYIFWDIQNIQFTQSILYIMLLLLSLLIFITIENFLSATKKYNL